MPAVMVVLKSSGCFYKQLSEDFCFLLKYARKYPLSRLKYRHDDSASVLAFALFCSACFFTESLHSAVPAEWLDEIHILHQPVS